MKKILIIQTAFIGDVILATALIESLSEKYPDGQIDFLLRKGNEGLLHEHPALNEVIIWDKKTSKYKNLRRIIKNVRATEYDILINLQRFASSGYLSWRSKAAIKVGFKKNPFSFSYDYKIDHQIDKGNHEVDRNFALLEALGKYNSNRPKLYPNNQDYNKANQIKGESNILVFAPSSVWFTKQLPKEKWMNLISQVENSTKIILIGGPSDKAYLEEIKSDSMRENIVNLAGELSLLESAALISIADRTYVNDSAPLHLASAMNSPVTTYFCSTVPTFGFGPLSDDNKVIETTLNLDCRPCGLHGKKQCPKGHFDCGNSIEVTI